MKRVLLGVISVVLVLASIFGIYASSVGLDDIPGIERNKNLQAADIEDAIDLIEENLNEYNDFIALKDELVNPQESDDAEVEEAPVETPEPSAAPETASSSSEYGKWQATYSNKQQAVADCQAKYDSAAAKVSSDKAALESAKSDLSAAQSKLNSIPSADSARNAAKVLERAKLNNDFIQASTAADSEKQLAAKNLADATAAYQASLGGYATIDELENARNNASSQISAANAEVERVEKQLSADQQALDSAKSNLDYANSEANYSKSQMDNAKASSTTNTDSSDNSKKDTEKATQKDEKAAKEAEETAEKLAKLKDSTDVKDIVEAGIQILLDNEDISSRVVDETDAEEVIGAAREYLEETKASVEKELSLRQTLYTALKILSFAGIAAGVIGFIVMISPKKYLFVAALILSAITAVAALALNAYGLMGGYLHFIYERANGGGNGNLQLLAMLIIAAAAILSVIIVIVSLSAFRKALRMRKLRQQIAHMNAKAGRNPR